MLRCGKLEVSGGFLLVAAILIYLDTQRIFPWALLTCAIHEWGHFAAANLMGGRVLKLRLTAVGAEMQLSSRRILSYGRELLVVLAGPAANLAAAFLAAGLMGTGGGERAFLFVGLNLAAGCFNLLPTEPLDGGRALKLILSILWSPEAAEGAMQAVTCLAALMMLAAGGVLLYRTRYNFTLLVVSLWILAAVFRR